jgi:hypothetical protein
MKGPSKNGVNCGKWFMHTTFKNTLNTQTIYVTCNLQNSLPCYLKVYIKGTDDLLI